MTSSIAEGCGAEAYHYTVARSSAEELKSELMIAQRLGYIDVERFESVLVKPDEGCRLIHGMIEAMLRKAEVEN